ncbi:MAG TPA: hypothetical protein VIT85_07060 [Solirubrobacterales bacterium]
MTKLPPVAGYEAAKKRLDELIALWSEDPETDRNEATTRLHFVDELLTGALGWPREQIVAEERLESKIADYVLGQPASRMIVEAKREGVTFELPAGVKSGVVTLETVMDSDAQTGEAVEQVLGYCQQRGVAIAAVTNGHQLIAFFASRQDGTPPLDGNALVFTSLEAMRDSYRMFWDNLSLPGVDSLALHSTLEQTETATPPAKLSSTIANYPGHWARNKIQTELKILGDLVLEDIIAAPELEREFLRQCYSKSGTLSEYALVSKEILEARYSALDSDGSGAAPTPARVRGVVADELASDVSAASLGKRPLILLGDVGVGKTIFIQHFTKIDAKEIMDKSVVLYINFGNEPALADDLNQHVMERFIDQLREDYGIDIEADSFVRQVYKHDLSSFARGVHSKLSKSDPKLFTAKEVELLDRKVRQRDRHLQHSFRYLAKTKRRQVVVFLDNIDQRDFGFQEQVFLIGQSLAETWPATVFLSLRPDTFHRSRTSGSLTAYQPRVFTIAPPEVGGVIRKRLSFCRSVVTNSEQREKVIPDALEERAEFLAEYLSIVYRSFDRSELVEFVENVGGGNIRTALEFVNTFVGSGHVDTKKILRIVEETGSYFVPFHEFVRAIIFGDYEYYEPAASPIANLFDISTPDRREHFLTPLILAFVERKGDVGQHAGYVGMESIMGAAQSMGFMPNQVEFAVRRAVRGRMLQRSSRIGDDAVARFRITTVGAYAYKKLLGRFVYLDAAVVDTPITNAGLSSKIGDCHDISDRLERAGVFQEYLDECWDAIDADGQEFSWSKVSAALEDDFEKIKRTLAKRHL